MPRELPAKMNLVFWVNAAEAFASLDSTVEVVVNIESSVIVNEHVYRSLQIFSRVYYNANEHFVGVCESLKPGGKASGWYRETDGPTFEPASTHLSLASVWFMDTVLWFCPPQVNKLLHVRRSNLSLIGSFWW